MRVKLPIFLGKSTSNTVFKTSLKCLSFCRDFTDYLSKEINDDITELASGTFLPMKCKEANKVLNGTYRNFSLECIHGSFQPPNEIPEVDDCVIGKKITWVLHNIDRKSKGRNLFLQSLSKSSSLV